MSATLMGAVFYLPLPKPEKMLLLALADHANDEGTSIYPGVNRLAVKTSDSVRNIKRLLRALEQRNVIAPVAHAKGGRGHATEWAINIRWVFEEARTAGWASGDAATAVNFDPLKGDTTGHVVGSEDTVKGDTTGLKGDTGVTPTIRKHHEEGTKRSLPSSLSSAAVTQTRP